MAIKAVATISLSTIKDISSIWRFYCLQPSTAAAPSTPDAATTAAFIKKASKTNADLSSTWVHTEPTYTTGSTNSLYTLDLTIYTDDTYSYSNVCLSSSYEAAKAAYNKAAQAQNAAESGANAASAAQTKANEAANAAATAQSTADSAGIAASKAQSTADTAKDDAATAQSDINGQMEYFWHDANGAHVLGSKTAATRYRTDIDSEGMHIKDVSGEVQEVAKFTANGAQIGKGSNAESAFLVDNDGIDLMRKGDNDYVYFHVGYSDDAIGKNGNVLPAPYYTVGNRQEKEDIGAYSYAEGQDVTSSGQASHAEGSTTKASAYCAHAEGGSSQATFSYAHAEGSGTKAMGEAAHAEGSGTKAMGGHSHTEGESTLASEAASAAHAEGELTKATDFCAHAEGYDTVAGGYVSHSEGSGTVASGSCSHAEGIGTVAKGSASHAQNYSTIAEFEYQTVLGKYNANAEGNVVEVGNGGDKNSRSNAVTIDWGGNVTAKGNITADGSIVMNGTNIKNLFSGVISVGYEDKSLDIAAGGNTGESTINLSKSGYSARCICGWNMSGTGSSNCVVPKLFINQTYQQLHYYIKNTGSSKATPKIRIYILYTKNN